MEMRQIAFESIRPFVRFAKEVPLSEFRKSNTVLAYDHRLMYIVSGIGVLNIGGSFREVHPGMVLYWMSGTPYCLRPLEGRTLQIISVNFDFTHEKSSTVRFLPLILPQEYRPEKCLEILQFTDATVLNGPVILSALPSVLPYLQAILSEMAIPDGYSDFQVSQLLSAVLNLVRRQASQRQSFQEHHGSLQKILEYIRVHYSEDLDNQTLARQFNYHPNYISRLIAEGTGIPLHQYLLKFRIQQAIYLLQSTDLPIHEIAVKVGFKNSSYFSQYFKKCTGYHPGAFRID